MAKTRLRSLRFCSWVSLGGAQPSLHLLLLVLLLQTHHSESLSGFVIHPVESASDIQDLADLRYNEWIVNDEDDGTSTTTTNTVSRHAFRCATAEIHEERSLEGAVAFLARTSSSAGDNQAVGAAELSPIELQGAILFCDSNGNTSINNQSHDRSNRILYVTDVLTAKDHRRKGVARALLHAMEEYAVHRVDRTTLLNNDDNLPILQQSSSSTSAVLLLLHVESSNHAALKFYRKLQYDENNGNLQASVAALVAADGDCQLDCDRLAENAGTVGQVLLGKLLVRGAVPL